MLVRMGRQIADPQTLHQRIDAPRGFPVAQALLKDRRLAHLLGKHLEVRSLSTRHRFPAEWRVRLRCELLALLLIKSLLLVRHEVGPSPSLRVSSVFPMRNTVVTVYIKKGQGLGDI
jgi:hypothetical protein